MSRVGLVTKCVGSSSEQLMPHMSTLRLQIPQLFEKRRQHTNTWTMTTQAQGGKKKYKKKDIQKVKEKKIKAHHQCAALHSHAVGDGSNMTVMTPEMIKYAWNL